MLGDTKTHDNERIEIMWNGSRVASVFEEQEGTLEARGREEERRGERSWGGVYYKKGGQYVLDILAGKFLKHLYRFLAYCSDPIWRR